MKINLSKTKSTLKLKLAKKEDTEEQEIDTSISEDFDKILDKTCKIEEQEDLSEFLENEKYEEDYVVPKYNYPVFNQVNKGKVKIPKNIDEFIEFGYVSLLVSAIRKFTIKDSMYTEDDLKQELLVKLCEKDKNGKTYFDRYDPTKRPFLVFIAVFARNYLSKIYKREHTRYGYFIANASALETRPQDSDEVPVKDVVYLDTLLLAAADQYEETELNIDLVNVRKELDGYKAKSSVTVDGVVLERSPRQVFDFILLGKTISEIKDILGVSQQYVYDMRKKIMNCKSMRELYFTLTHSAGEKPSNEDLMKPFKTWRSILLNRNKK